MLVRPALGFSSNVPVQLTRDTDTAGRSQRGKRVQRDLDTRSSQESLQVMRFSWRKGDTAAVGAASHAGGWSGQTGKTPCLARAERRTSINDEAGDRVGRRKQFLTARGVRPTEAASFRALEGGTDVTDVTGKRTVVPSPFLPSEHPIVKKSPVLNHYFSLINYTYSK